MPAAKSSSWLHPHSHSMICVTAWRWRAFPGGVCVDLTTLTEMAYGTGSMVPTSVVGRVWFNSLTSWAVRDHHE